MHLVQNSEGWSKNALASEFNIDRRAIDKLLKPITPCGKKSGHPIWNLRDVVVPIAQYLLEDTEIETGVTDPEKLKPKARKDWYDSENQRLKYEEQMGRLIPADEVATVWAELFKSIKLSIITARDVIERDVGLNVEQGNRLDDILNGLLNNMADKIDDIEINSASNDG